MAKKLTKTIKKQAIGHFFTIVAWLTLFMLARFLWNLEDMVQYTILLVGVLIIIIGIVIDVWTFGDMINYFKN